MNIFNQFNTSVGDIRAHNKHPLTHIYCVEGHFWRLGAWTRRAGAKEWGKTKQISSHPHLFK